MSGQTRRRVSGILYFGNTCAYECWSVIDHWAFDGLGFDLFFVCIFFRRVMRKLQSSWFRSGHVSSLVRRGPPVMVMDCVCPWGSEGWVFWSSTKVTVVCLHLLAIYYLSRLFRDEHIMMINKAKRKTPKVFVIMWDNSKNDKTEANNKKNSYFVAMGRASREDQPASKQRCWFNNCINNSNIRSSIMAQSHTSLLFLFWMSAENFDAGWSQNCMLYCNIIIMISEEEKNPLGKIKK